MPKDYVCANKGPLQRAGTGQSSAVNLLQKTPRLQDSLTSFSMTSVASQTHPSQPFCYPGSPPCHTLGLLGLPGCQLSIPSHLPSGCGSDTASSGEPSFPWPLLSLLLTSCFRGVSHCPNVFYIGLLLHLTENLGGQDPGFMVPYNPKASQRTWHFKARSEQWASGLKTNDQATAFHLPETHWWRTSHFILRK